MKKGRLLTKKRAILSEGFALFFTMVKRLIKYL